MRGVLMSQVLSVLMALCGFMVFGSGTLNAQQVEFKEGVLTGFTNVEGKARLCRVHYSPDGTNLGGGEIVYEGISAVVCMMPYKGGVLTAFSNVGGNPHNYRIHFSPDGKNLGNGEIRYEGTSPISAMTPYKATP